MGRFDSDAWLASAAPVATAVLAAVLLGACGPSEPPAPQPQPPAPAPVPAPPAATPAPAPVAKTGGDPAGGEAVYQIYCASCHGPRGDGDGPAALALDPKPARHSDGAYMNALGNDYLFEVIREGGAAVGKSPLMAAWGGSLSDEQIRDVIAFVRTLAKPPYRGEAP